MLLADNLGEAGAEHVLVGNGHAVVDVLARNHGARIAPRGGALHAIHILRIEQVIRLSIGEEALGQLTVAVEFPTDTPTAVTGLDGLIHIASHRLDVHAGGGILVLEKRVVGLVVATGSLATEADLQVALGLGFRIPEPIAHHGSDVADACGSGIASDTAVFIGR